MFYKLNFIIHFFCINLKKSLYGCLFHCRAADMIMLIKLKY